MNGLYKFYVGDKLVLEQKNALTVNGRALILKSLLGLIPSIGGSVVIGVDDEANPSLNADNLIELHNMGFPVSNAQVSMTSLDATGSTDALIFKATFNDISKYVIREVGLYPSTQDTEKINAITFLLYSGAGSDGWKNSSGDLLEDITTSGESQVIESAPTGTEFRIGSEAVLIKAGDTIDSTKVAQDLSLFGDKDILKIAADSATTSTTLQIKFKVDGSNYYAKTFTFSAAEYQIFSCTKDELVATGSPTWDSITEVSLTTATGAVVLDGIRFDDADIVDPNYGLVSRAKLATAIDKNAGEPVTIEYYLTLGFNRS